MAGNSIPARFRKQVQRHETKLFRIGETLSGRAIVAMMYEYFKTSIHMGPIRGIDDLKSLCDNWPGDDKMEDFLNEFEEIEDEMEADGIKETVRRDFMKIAIAKSKVLAQAFQKFQESRFDEEIREKYYTLAYLKKIIENRVVMDQEERNVNDKLNRHNQRNDKNSKNVDAGAASGARDVNNGECFNCGKLGHFSRDCTKPKPDKGKGKGKGREEQPRGRPTERTQREQVPEHLKGICWFHNNAQHAQGKPCTNDAKQCGKEHKIVSKADFDKWPKPGRTKSRGTSKGGGKGKGKGQKTPPHCAQYLREHKCKYDEQHGKGSCKWKHYETKKEFDDDKAKLNRKPKEE